MNDDRDPRSRRSDDPRRGGNRPPPRRSPTEEPTRPVPPRIPTGGSSATPTTRIPATGPDLRTRPVPRVPAPRDDRDDDAPTTRHPRLPAADERPTVGRATPPPVRRTGRRRPRTLGRALLTTVAATVAPGAGHLMLNRRRTGGAILGVFVAAVAVLLVVAFTVRRSALLASAVSTPTLVVGAVGCVLVALAWVAVIIRTWVIAQPRGLDPRRRAAGVAAVVALCLVVAAPFGYAARLADSQRALLDKLFSGGGGTSAAEAIGKARLNILLVGSDAGPDRTGTRTDTMIVASVEVATGRTTLFSLPRNIGHAQFPPGSEMAEEFPDGFHDEDDPASGDYLLNAVYAYGNQFPELAPDEPTADPGLNLLHQTVGYMLGLHLDYYVELNMAGFASIVDALGGLRIDVGPERIPIGGISPSGREVEPEGYLEPGLQRLDGAEALAFARSRTNSTDYVRMGRQRCLIQNILEQKSATDLITNFQAIAGATTANVATNIPQEVLPALVSIADNELALESVSFDPNLPDPDEPDGRFNTGDPDFSYMREVVREANDRDPVADPPTVAAAPSDIPETSGSSDDDAAGSAAPTSGDDPAHTSTPVSVARSC